VTRQLPRRTVAIGLVVGIVAVSTSAVLARVAMGPDPGVADAPSGYAPALAVAFWRTTLGALALAPLALRERRRTGAPLPRGTGRLLAASGGALGLHFALWLGSLALTTVAASVTLVTISPVFVALGGWWLLGERTTRRTGIGIALTIAGALLIGLADAGAEAPPQALAGDALALGGSLAVSAYMLLGRRLRRDVGAMTYASIVYGWAAVVMLVVCLVGGVDLWGYAPRAWLAILGILVGPQLLGHTVFNALLSTVTATVVALVVVAEPVGATLLAWAVLGELPSALFWLGAPLVLVGVVVATARGRSRPVPA
jgi:drug/metabolite transporter (DMT)-like permease